MTMNVMYLYVYCRIFHIVRTDSVPVRDTDFMLKFKWECEVLGFSCCALFALTCFTSFELPDFKKSWEKDSIASIYYIHLSFRAS